MLHNSARVINNIMQRYLPDPLALAYIITIVVFLLGITLTENSPVEMIVYWGGSFWNLLEFTVQMIMMLLAGYIIASSKPVKLLIFSLIKHTKSPGQAIIIVTLITSCASWLNWSLGLVLGAMLCREMLRVVPTVNYGLLVASAYSGCLMFHGGLSASIPLIISTENNFTYDLIGQLIPIRETLFSATNVYIIIALLISLPLVNWLMSDKIKHDNTKILEKLERQEKNLQANDLRSTDSFFEKNPLISLAIFSLGVIFIVSLNNENKLYFDFNTINFILLFIGLLLHQNVSNFIHAANSGIKNLAPILIQFPFYAGIMGMMKFSGLVDIISDLLFSIASSATLPVFTFYSAGFVNLLVPSGGGQWAVQGPLVITMAQALNVDIAKVAMAVAWGDSWSNLIQPFWALPVLAISGLKIRDIMGYCVITFVHVGLIISVILIFI